MTTKAEALAAKAALVDFLLERGWQQHVHTVYPWRDPETGRAWSFEAALQIALKREDT